MPKSQPLSLYLVNFEQDISIFHIKKNKLWCSIFFRICHDGLLNFTNSYLIAILTVHTEHLVVK